MSIIPVSIRNLYHKAQAILAIRRFGHPGRALKVIGITGTDGKTTTTHLVESVLQHAGKSTGVITTIGVRFGNEEAPTGLHVTTPHSSEVQAYLRQMVDRDIEYAIIETTSHGLAQHRVLGVEYDVAVITNITSEHLDYHKTYDKYRSDKGLLFKNLATSWKKKGIPKVAILNLDDASYDYLSQFSADRYLSYSIRESDASVIATNIKITQQGTSFSLCFDKKRTQVQLALLGEFNVSNALAAACVGISQGIDVKMIKQGLETLKAIPGRMERIENTRSFSVFVDFAHTPNALQNALQLFRTILDQVSKKERGLLILVFGCAGERDPFKREEMGAIAGRYADRVIITSEDPRNEDPLTIIKQIEGGLLKTSKRKGKEYWCISDRKEAIAFAVSFAAKGDIIDITGKGHEQSFCIKGVEYPWDDREVAREILETSL